MTQYKPIIYTHPGVPLDVKAQWKVIITTVMMSLEPHIRRIVPPFYIYNTMVECLHHTFLPSHPMVDKLMDQYAVEKVWSFAFLQHPEVRNPAINEDSFRRIVIANSKAQLTPDLTKEMIVLHEIGHFHMFDNLHIPYTTETKTSVEQKCNCFAIQKYGRLITLFPQYKTDSSDKQVKLCEMVIREFVAANQQDGVPLQEICSNVERMLGEIVNDRK